MASHFSWQIRTFWYAFLWMIFIYIIAILYLVAVMFNPNLASIGGVAWFYLFLIVAIAVLVSIPKGISMLIGGILSGVFALLTLFSIISSQR